MSLQRSASLAFILALACMGPTTLCAQPGRPGGPGGQPVPGQPNPGQPGQPNPGEAKPGEAKPGEAKPGEQPGAGAPAPINRSALKRPEIRGKRLVLPLGPDGKVQLSFVGQKWLDVLEWYADLAGLSLDWQELPGDELNLRTQRSYTVDEVRDILNRHLLDRGYTLLLNGEVLTVANLKKLDAGLLPRVDLKELDTRQDHEFVKVSFRLDWLIAEQAVEELKPMLSPYGKLVGLKATNRIEAIDAVANLREIASLLSQEQSDNGQERLVQEFKLQHVRADDAYSMLMDLLGQEKPKKDDNSPMDPRKMMQMQQQMQMMQQMQQQGGGKPGGPMQPSKVYLVVNRRENSILANGPPNLIAVVAQAVKTLDVPSENDQSLLQNPNRMQVYRLSAIDPEAFAEVLQELGQLDPNTQVKVDKKNKAIIVQGTLADHLTIRQLVDRMDGTDRNFQVVRLRRLEAEYVAGTIEFMMGAGEKKQNNRRSYSFYYDPFGSSGGNSEEANPRQGFRVDADVEHNRLLIWANEVEMAEVTNLLQKLGEIPVGEQVGSRLRRLDSIPLEDGQQVLERLRELWPAMGNNPLIIEPAPQKPEPRKPAEPSTDAGSPARPRPTSRPENSPSFRFSKSTVRRAAPSQLLAEAATEPAEEARESAPPATGGNETAAPGFPARRNPRIAEPAPVRILQDANGRWTLQSEDTAALDRIEDLLQDLTPPRKDYRIFQMKNKSTWAWGVAQRLEDFFKEEKGDDNSNRSRFWYYEPEPAKDAERSRLSKKKPLKFIPDSDSNSILVTGADPAQMRIIEELIEAFDVPAESDSMAVRKTQIFPLRFSKAKVVADAIKDVYRDLLSENDKALANQQKKDDQRPVERTVTYLYDPPAAGDSQAPPSPVKFKGLLSIGVDELSNTLVVSATEGLLENIGQMIDSLDDAARPTVPSMQVLQVRGIPLDELQKKLDKMLKEPKSRQPKPNQPQNGQPQNGQPQQQPQQAGPFGDED